MSRALAVALLLMLAATAQAGMPSFRLSDAADLRLSAISFFAVLWLALSGLAMWLWNLLQRDFPRLPRLTYRRALAATTLWGLLLIVVLTMISGARELMTPGAWRRQGATHRLVDEPPLVVARQRQFADLRDHLWRWADTHDGAFPPHEFVAAIPERAWLALDGAQTRLLYVAGQRRDGGRLPLAYEPAAMGAQRLVLYTDGTVTAVAGHEIEQQIAAGRRATPAKP